MILGLHYNRMLVTEDEYKYRITHLLLLSDDSGILPCQDGEDMSRYVYLCRDFGWEDLPMAPLIRFRRVYETYV